MNIETFDTAVMKLIGAGIAITLLVVLLARADQFNKIVKTGSDSQIAFMKAAAGI